MGFLSRLDNKLAVGGIEELDPGRDNIIDDVPNALLMDPLAIPAAGIASGNLGPFGTPTEKGVNNPLAVEGITDVAHDKGAEIAAIIAAGSWLGGGAGGWFEGGEGAAGAEGAGAVGYDPGAEGMFVGDAAGGGAGTNDGLLLALADTGTTTDVTPGLVETPVVSDAGAGEFTGAYNAETSSAGNAMNNEPGWGSSNSNATTTKGGGSNLMGTAAKYGIPLALLGASTALSTKKQEMPNKQQYQELSAEAQAMARELLAQYKAGRLSPAQQAQLDQLTQNQKNQINNYYANIGQAGSTSHQQALNQVDIQALGVQANMLQTTLNQGLQAIGIAMGPLNAMANYQMQQDKRMQDAYANLARSMGYLYGMNAPTQQSSGQQPQA